MAPMVVVDGQRIALLAIVVVGDALTESINAVINSIIYVIETTHQEVIGVCTFKTSPFLMLYLFSSNIKPKLPSNFLLKVIKTNKQIFIINKLDPDTRPHERIGPSLLLGDSQLLIEIINLAYFLIFPIKHPNLVHS